MVVRIYATTLDASANLLCESSAQQIAYDDDGKICMCTHRALNNYVAIALQIHILEAVTARECI